MGLFTAASAKANKAGVKEDRPSPGEAAAASKSPAACDLGLAPELESALDVLWSRLCRRDAPGTAAPRAWVIAHWEPDEGATTLTAALALRAAQLGPNSTFCVADFDLFRPGLSYLTGLATEPGLSNVLRGQVALDAALAGTQLPNLRVLPAGYPTLGAHAAQMHERCQHICELLLHRFDYVLLDTPALRSHPNFVSWAGRLAQCVLVVRAGQARQPAVAKAIRILKLMQLDVAAVALNAREYYVPEWLYART